MAKIMANGVLLNYEIRGAGPKLLFLNGIGADMRNPMNLFNAPLARRFTILAFDPRGLGESGKTDGDFTIGDMAEDAARLAQAVGWEKYHVFGASMGGMVAQELAIAHPEAVDRLVLAVTHAGGENGAPMLVDKMAELTPLEMLKASDVRQDKEWAAEHPEALERMKAQSAGMKALFTSEGYLAQAKAVCCHDTAGRLGRITAETLAFNGRYDGGVPVDAAQGMADKILNCRFALVDHGHGSWFFDPSVWDMVIGFLEG
jgi:3-oxoadipate enol-lactonase